MKKVLSFMLSAALGASVFVGSGLNAESESGSNNNFVLFGDSIASGYGLAENEYNYGQICADYYDSDVANYAVSGDTSDDLLKVIAGLDASQRQTVADSGIIVISVGGNDILHYTSKYLINYAAKKNMLNAGYTSADIPDDPDIGDLKKYVNFDGKGGLIEYAKSGFIAASELAGELKLLAANLRIGDNEKYEGIIANKTVPNIQKAVNDIKAINPDAKIIVQTIYQPIQIEKSYIDENYGENASAYNDLIGQIRSNYRFVMEAFRTELQQVEGIAVADVLYDFTSVADGVSQNALNPGHANYFTDIQKSGDERDLHPNQKGHLAIAAKIINTVGELHDDSGLLSQLYKNLNDKSKYPSIALDTYKTAAGKIMKGDVNFDEKVDSRDTALVMKNYANLSSGGEGILSEIQSDCSNVNGDEKCNLEDAYEIMKYYTYVSAGNICTFEEFQKIK